jgi:peroxiredoxin
MAVETPTGSLGAKASDFALPDTNGRVWTLADIAGPRGTLVVFMCNHCPYVLAIIDRLNRDAAALKQLGIGVVGINANDAVTYPDDSFDNMVTFAKQHGLGFPYLHDESQQVARTYGAVCTPDFFGFDAAGVLRYRGRLDASGRQPGPPDAKRELVEAMRLIAETGETPDGQVPSIGCSIKWRDE